jgi:hypothetical protein
MTAPVRTVEQVDRELQTLVKGRSSNRAAIQQLMGRVVESTGLIDKLLAERSLLTATCPPSPAELVAG